MKKTIIGLLIAAMLSTTAYAASVEVSNSNVAEITVNIDGRKKGEYVNILVCDKGTTPAQLEEDVTKIIHQGSVIASGEGIDKYAFRLNIPKDTVSKDYDVYIGGEEKAYDLYYVSFDSIVKIAEELAGITSESEAEEKLNTYKRELSLSNELFDNASIKSVAQKLVASNKDSSQKLTFENAEKDVSELQRRIKQYACLSCFEDSKKDVLFKDGEYLYRDVVAFDSFSEDKNTLLEILNGKINSTGKNDVFESLFGSKIKTADELKERYAGNIICSAIKNSVYSGYGYISDIITEANAKEAGINVSEYLNFTDKNTANRKISESKNSLTTDNLETVIKNSAKKTDSSSRTPTGGGTSSPRNPSPVISGNNDSKNNDNDNNKPKFSDISGHWAKDIIEKLAAKNIISGYEDGTFLPDKTIKREEACKIIATAFNIENGTDLNYSDVAKNEWFYPYVSSLAGAGVINGISDDSFGTGIEVTRESFATMIYRLLKLEPSAESSKFTDNYEISDWAADAVAALSAEKIINGYEDGNFMPKKAVTRGEAAAIISAILKD